jgi:putative hydrolase of the HAD superfamily
MGLFKPHLSVSSPITTLVFDWGDTLMMDNPQCTGSMADWPQVAAVPGIHQTLAQLSSQFSLAVATNAGVSTAQKVRQALKRVELDHYFDQIFTSRDLDAAKPHLDYFRAIESKLAATPSELVMIGDGYLNDVLGPCHAGWRAIWFNPHDHGCTSLTPLHSAEISHMADLPLALQSLELPTVAECLLWLRQQDATFNLIQHVQTVAACTYQMALWLRAAGHTVDPVLAHRGGLLHDLGKINTLRGQSSGLNHGEFAAKLLNEWGYPQLAGIAQSHLLFSITDPASRPASLEEKVVYFCDKIVESNRVVPVDVRIAKLQQRYTQDSQKILDCLPALSAMQQELCAAMQLSEEQLIPRLATALLET